MIVTNYKLIRPHLIEAVSQNLDLDTENVIVRPEVLSICKADMRYFFGMRDNAILKQRLPLTLIHEAVGTIVYDPNKRMATGEKVVLLPNIPGADTRFGENYRMDSRFRSSKADGFMQEIVALPESQVLPYNNIPVSLASYTEFISVGVHAVKSYLSHKVSAPSSIGVWGDGSLGYVICFLLKYYCPDTKITVIGVNKEKLNMFQFVDCAYTTDEVSNMSLTFDDAFECVGGVSSGTAISQIIDYICPEGIICLLGVSEEAIQLKTRMILEKGLMLIGRSRSTREDFIETIKILSSHPKYQAQLSLLISEEICINKLTDINLAFKLSELADFKVVMKWNL